MTTEINLIGLTVEEVKQRAVITGNMHFLPEGSIVTMDYNPYRTRIWYDGKTNIVTRVTHG